MIQHTHQSATCCTPATATDALPATTTYTKTIPFECDTEVTYEGNSITIDDFKLTAAISFAVPFLKPNAENDPVDVSIDLTLEEGLRDAAAGLPGGVAADGASTDVYLIQRADSGDPVRRITEMPKISAPKSPIPQEKNAPWVIRASGTTPAINTLGSSEITITAPEKFTILANIYKADGSSQPARLVCETQADRTVAVLPLGERATVTPRLPASIKARTASSFRTEVRAATKPTGTVTAQLEDGTRVDTENLNANGDVRLQLSKFGKTGKRTLTITYSGDGVHGIQTVKKSFTVTR